MKRLFVYDTVIGKVGFVENGKAITHIFLGTDPVPRNIEEKETPLIRRAAYEVIEYLAGRRTVFNMPLEAEGTEFQKQVWAALSDIPYGETRSYKQIAEKIGKPKAYRAVGMANNRNPLSIVVPCHRVIGNNGSLIGYAGGLDVKKRLLDMEKEVIQKMP